MKPIIFIFILLIFFQNICSAGLYQYKDKNGMLHFTENLAEVPAKESPSLQDVIREKDEAIRKQRDNAEEEAYRNQHVAEIQPLLSLLMQEGVDLKTRQSVALSIGKIKDPGAVSTLVNALNHANKEIRQCAILALGEVGNHDAAEPLAALINDTDRVIQSEAVKALGKIKDPRSVKPLIAAFKDQGTHYIIKENIADALAQIRDPQIVELLIGVLKEKGYKDETQTRAANVLGKIGEPKAIDPLFALLKDKEARFITRNAAAESIGKINDQKSLKLLTDALRDEDKYVRQQAGVALAIMKYPDSIPFLLNALNDSDNEVVQNACFALSQIGLPAMDSLISVLKDKSKNVYIRSCVANALGIINDPLSGNALKSAAGDVNENQHIRRAANDGLQKLREQQRYIKIIRDGKDSSVGKGVQPVQPSKKKSAEKFQKSSPKPSSDLSDPDTN